MNLVITYNDKAFAYFGENHNPAFYEEEITQALGGLANGFSWKEQMAKVKVAKGILDTNADKTYQIHLTLNEAAQGLIKHWAGIAGKVGECEYIEWALNRRMDPLSQNWRVGTHITVQPV